MFNGSCPWPRKFTQQVSKIAKAADQGLQAYKPGATLSSEERVRVLENMEKICAFESI